MHRRREAGVGSGVDVVAGSREAPCSEKLEKVSSTSSWVKSTNSTLSILTSTSRCRAQLTCGIVRCDRVLCTCAIITNSIITPRVTSVVNEKS